MERHRSLRGSLTTKTKEAVFSVFGEANLPSVNTKFSPEEIRDWKATYAARCYRKLFEPMLDDPEVTYMSKILEKVFVSSKASDKASDNSMAFVISVSETFLNPKNESIHINEDALKTRLERNLVNFRFFVKKVVLS